MKNYGKNSFITSLVSWLVFLLFIWLSSKAREMAYQGYRVGLPTPDTTLAYILTRLALLSYPLSFVAVIFAIIAVYKKQNLVRAILGGFAGALLILFMTFLYFVLVYAGGV